VFKDLPRPLIAVVDKALALEKPRRWASARAMQAALREAVPAPGARAKGSLPVPAAPPMPEPLEGPTSIATLVNAPIAGPTSAPSPPSIDPTSGPTAVIPMKSQGAPGDPWTDQMSADDLDAPTVATSGSIQGLPSPAIRSAIVARPPLPSLHSDGESTMPITREERESSRNQQTTMRLDSLAQPAPQPARPSAAPPPPAPPTPSVPPMPRAVSAYGPPPPMPRDVHSASFAPPPPPAPWNAPRFGAPPAMQAPMAAGPTPVVIAAIAIGSTVLVALMIGGYFLLQAL
jgi:hypothetical protein